MYLIRSVFYCSLLFVCTALSAQDAEVFPPNPVKRSLNALRVEGTPKVDGRLDEAMWREAPSASGFTQIEPLQGNPPGEDTEFRVLFNKQYLYIGVFARDSLGKSALRATDFKRDFSPRQHDHILVSMDGFQDGRNAMAFATNAYGVQRDLLAFDDIFYDEDWDGLWRVRTSRTDSGWAAEIAIPWLTLRYPGSADSLQTWGFNLARNRRAVNEISAFSPFPRSFTPTRMEYAGQISGLQPPPPKANVRLQPYTLFSYDRYRKPGEQDSEGTGVKAGGELKWALNTNTVLDLTANTDFAQADVDRQVNNVTRFSVFFPERRQFFLENASLFGFYIGPSPDFSGGSMRIQPFFSRSIGLDGSGRPIPIQAGGRLVYRSAKQNFGAMAIRQRERGGAATDFFVGRYSRNFGEQNRIGGLMTVKNGPEGTNVVGTLDGFVRIDEKQSLNAFAMHTSGGNSARPGFAGIAQYYHSTNTHKIWLTQSVVTKDFNPEMGFVSRTDVIATTPGMNWFYRGKLLPLRKYIRAFEPGFLPEFYWQASTGKLIERQAYFFPLWFNLQNGGFLGYGMNPIFQGLTETFSPLGISIPAGEYHYWRHLVFASSDPSKVLSLMGMAEWGTYFNGELRSLDLNLQFAPSPHFSLLARMNRNRFLAVGVPAKDETVDLYSIEGRLALNPRLQLIGFYQQNSENDARNYNIRLAWEYQPLSFLYIVLNNRGFRNELKIRQTEDHAIVKFSLLKQI